MELPNQNQVLAFGRHVVTFGAGAITVLATVNIISADQANMLKTSLTQTIQAFGELSAAIAPIVAIISGYLASRSASPASQVKAVTVIAETNPELVTSVSNNKIIPNSNGAN